MAKSWNKGVTNRLVMLVIVCVALLVTAPQAFALSRSLPQPDIFFPKGYEPKKAPSMLSVLQDKQFKYIGGLTSYWPAIEPTSPGPKSLAYPTFLYYNGDTASLQEFMTALTKLNGLHVQLSFSRKVEQGSWQVIYSHTTPDTLVVTVNLASEQLDLEELHLPEWKKDT